MSRSYEWCRHCHWRSAAGVSAETSCARFHKAQDRGWTDVRPAFGFVLLAARDQPTSVTELAELMGMTKQAASKLVDAMVSAGYIQRGTDPQDGRQRPVTLGSLLTAVGARSIRSG
jgi:MarR family